MERKGFGASDFEEIKIDYCQFVIVDDEKKKTNALVYYVKKKNYCHLFLLLLEKIILPKLRKISFEISPVTGV